MKNKRIGVIAVLILAVVLAITVFACGDKGGNKGDVDPMLPTLIKVRVLPQSNDFNGDEEHDVCLALLGKTIEKFTIEVLLSNPDNYEVLSLKYNGKEYQSKDFDSSSTNKVITISNLTVEPTITEFEVSITDIYYAYKGSRQKVANLTNNVKKVKVNPTFKLTLDLSETNLGEGAIEERENRYASKIDLIYEYAMNEYKQNDYSAGFISGMLGVDATLYGKEGYIFAGWFTEPNGLGDRYATGDLYTFYSDITLYAHYDRPLEYKVTETEAIVTGLSPVGKNTEFTIVVPESFQGKPVKRIAPQAFVSVGAGKKYLLPDSLVEIGDYAFHKCTGITVEMNRVEKIGKFAFAECGDITLGRGAGLFKNPEMLPTTLKEIGDYAFKGCSWNSVIPNPLRPEDALFGAYFSEEDMLVIPSNVEYLGNYAFTESLFTKVYFQKDSALNNGFIGKSVFEGSKLLKSLYTAFEYRATGTDQINTSVEGGLQKITEKMFYNCILLSCEEGMLRVKLNEGLVEIGELAFAASNTGTTKFNYLKLPDSLLRIGTQAFANSGLRRVDFSPNSKLQNLGKWCFENSEFESINIYSCNVYEESPFWGNTNLKAINILTDNVPTYKVPTSIGLTRKAKYYVKKEMLASFRAPTSTWNKESTILDDYIYIAAENILCYDFIATDAEGLQLCFEPVNDDGSLDTTFTSNNVRVTSVLSTETTINVPTYFSHGGTYKTVVGIGKFFIHQEVKKVSLPWTVKRIEDSAFYACNFLKELVWKKDSVEYVKDSAAGIALTHIGKRAFYATDLTYFFANDALTNIGGEAFMLCDQLKKVVLDKGEITVGVSAFSQSGIELLVLGNSVKHVGRSAFQNNNNLKYVLIEHSAVPFADATESYYPDISPFNSCGGIEAVYLFSNNALRSFTEKKFSNNEVNTYSGLKKADGITSAYEKYSKGLGTWTEAIEEFKVRETE